MYAKKISPDIYVVEDFVSEAERLEVFALINSLTESSWYSVQTKETDFFWGKQFTREVRANKDDILIRLTDRVMNLVQGRFFDNNQVDGEIVKGFIDIGIHRYFKGDYIGAHRDNHEYSLDTVRFGICIYYNDDYEGGELFYPELDITYKPKAGDLVIHGGNILHQSLPVTNDSIRYISTCFAKGTSEYPITLNQEVFGSIEEEDGSLYY